jgi:hypothetical protein
MTSKPYHECMFTCSICHMLIDYATEKAIEIGKCDDCIEYIKRETGQIQGVHPDINWDSYWAQIGRPSCPFEECGRARAEVAHVDAFSSIRFYCKTHAQKLLLEGKLRAFARNWVRLD